MGKTNARGYAWLTKTPGWNTTRWEWLHIRAASLGGSTDGTNLVLGTRDSNTHMMPFESNIKSLSKIANENPKYDNVKVKFSAARKLGAPHKYQDIKISWKLHKNPSAVGHVKEPEGEATFSPLKTGSVLSKTEVEMLEDALRAAKEGL